MMHPTISSSGIPFSSCPQSFPASGSFPMRQLFALGGQSIGASVWVLPMNIQSWFPLRLSGLISLLSMSLLQNCSSKASILQRSASFMVQFSHLYMTTGKTIALTRQTFVIKVISLIYSLLFPVMTEQSLKLVSGHESTISPDNWLFWLKPLSFLLTFASQITGFWAVSGWTWVW